MPDWKKALYAHLRPLHLAPEREVEIVEELAEHLDDRYKDLLSRGFTPEEAQRMSLAELTKNNPLANQIRKLEPTHQEPIALGSKGTTMFGGITKDIRYAGRMLRKHPAFASIVVLTLTLGIGASTAIFSIVNAVILRPLPFANPDKLVLIFESNPERGWPIFGVSHPNFLDWKDQNRSFEHIAAYGSANLTIKNGGETEVVPGGVITAGFLPVLGATPIRGRNFLPEEDRPGGNTRVVLLTEGFWKRRLGGDPDIVGKPMTLNDNPFTVVGVLPESFAWGRGRLELFVPMAPDPARNRSDHRLGVIGRLKNDVTMDQALVDMNTIAQRLGDQYPDSNKGWKVGTQSFFDWLVPKENRDSLVVILAAVVFLLLIACSNVANLLLARASSRQREMSVRVALGAGRLRIVRQLLAEALVLALAGGILGLGLAALILKGVTFMSPASLPRLDELSIDTTVLVFAFLLSLATGVLFGLVPAIQASKPNLNEMLKEGGRNASGGVGRQRLRSILVMSEVALSVALLVGASLLVRSFSRLLDVRPGFDPERAMTLRMNLPRSSYAENPRAWAFYQRLLTETKSLPGVESVALTSLMPLGTGGTSSDVAIPGKTASSDGSKPSASWRIVSPGYFTALRIPVRGREFDARDTADGPRVTIISEEMARRYWPGEDALGKSVNISSFGAGEFRIIGVAGDVRSVGLERDAPPMVYASTAFAATWNPMFLVVRSGAPDPMSLVPGVRGVVRSIDSNVAISDAQTLERLLSDSIGSRRFNLWLLGSFAATALILACVGLFGVMAYLVSQRTHEIGIRLALGARPQAILKSVVGRGMALASVGLLLGLAGAFWLSRFLGSLLFQIAPTDPVAFVVAPLLLGTVALAACYVPARRAMRVDPVKALRNE